MKNGIPDRKRHALVFLWNKIQTWVVVGGAEFFFRGIANRG